MKYSVIAKKNCPFCKGAINLLRDNMESGDELRISYEGEDFSRTDFKDKFGKDATYPRIYFNSKFIGGCDDLHDLLKR